MEEVFEEWNIYSLKRLLKSRAIDLENIERNAQLKIVGITGIRRSGKSSILILLQQKITTEGKKSAYVNLEDSRIKNSVSVLK